METGTYISGIGHVAVIGWAMLGGSLLDIGEPPELQVTEVSVISQAAFAAMVSSAPKTETDIAATISPETDTSDTVTPKADADSRVAALAPPATPQDAGTKPKAPVIETARASVQQDAPAEMQPPSTESVGATLVSPTAPVSDRDSAGRVPDKLAMVAPAESPAPKVDTQPAKRPDPSAERAKEVEKATTPDPGATTSEDQKTEKAPDEASSEIVTEPKETKTEAAPQKSSRPKGRPADLGDKASQQAAIEAAMAEAVSEAGETASSSSIPPRPSAAPVGPPLTAAETEGLKLAVQACWNINPTSEAARITVVVGFQMERTGKPLLSTIRLISASEGSEAAKLSAFDAARRAIIRCGANGYDLPDEKFEQWREIETTFNPDKMRNK